MNFDDVLLPDWVGVFGSALIAAAVVALSVFTGI